MDFVGAFPEEGDWESLMSKMFSAEDMEFSPHFLSQHLYNNNTNNLNSQNTNFDQLSNINTINIHEGLFHQLSQEASTSADSGTQESYNYVLNNNDHDSNYHINTDEFFAPNFLMDQNIIENIPSNSLHPLKRNINEENSNAAEMSDQNPKKKPRVSKLYIISNLA